LQIERGGRGVKGKSAEAFNPAGPWLVTPHEVPNARVIFKPAEIVHYLSQFLVLEHGDLINTVTPPGVGMGLTPPAG
jgi:2-keto-4-pentenoate hydratase/2-oxohepta-3-ene-1,7-dioic acid hydratase in catechol pathway